MDGGTDIRKQPQLLFYEAITGQFPQGGALLRVVKDRFVSSCLWINLRTLISQGVRPAGAGKAHQRRWLTGAFGPNLCTHLTEIKAVNGKLISSPPVPGNISFCLKDIR